MNQSRLVAWAVHMAGHFVKRAKREARRRPLAAKTHKFVGGSSSDITHIRKINSEDSGGGGGFSPRVSTASRMGLRSEHESDDTRRGVEIELEGC
jgi:hypothetical protein